MPDSPPTEPDRYARRILLAVTGLSPQIVTETLYALAVERRSPPTEVRVITTLTGAERIRGELLRPESGWFHRLRNDYDLPAIAFDENYVHILKDASGKPLDDIRSIKENTLAADAITDILRKLSEDDDCSLHVSIAGGRKTMGFYLGYALSLYGRPQDQLSHVLVTPPYESHPEFFYPSKTSELICDRDGRSHDKRAAQVTLAEIPFVRMRDGLNPDLLEGRAAFSEVVEDAQRALPPVRLVLDPTSRTVHAGGESFTMQAIYFAFYWMLAERAQASQPGVSWWPQRTSPVATELLSYYVRVVGELSGDYESAKRDYGNGMKDSTFNANKSKIKDHLVKNLGQRRAEPYRIQTVGRHPRDRRYGLFGLTLPPDAIEIKR